MVDNTNYKSGNSIPEIVWINILDLLYSFAAFAHDRVSTTQAKRIVEGGFWYYYCGKTLHIGIHPPCALRLRLSDLLAHPHPCTLVVVSGPF